MEEKLLVSLQELQNAINSGGSIDTGDISYDSIKVILNYVENQIKENEKYIIKMTDEQYKQVIDLVEHDINKKWEDKIKAKIEELEKEKSKYTGYKGLEFSRTGLINAQKLVLQELLEEEKIYNAKLLEKIKEYEEILQSSIIKEDYKLEVQHIIGVLKELKGDN